MSKSKHTEAQIIAALEQVDAGRRWRMWAREVGVSKHRIYAWKAKYGGMDASEAREAKQPCDENTKLGKLVAEPHPLKAPIRGCQAAVMRRFDHHLAFAFSQAMLGDPVLLMEDADAAAVQRVAHRDDG